MTRIRPTLLLCTARYSDNLGDGVIGDCLQFMIQQQLNADIQHYDIAGRQSQTSTHAHRFDYKQLFYKLPATLRPIATLLAWPVLFRPKLDAAWSELDHTRIDAVIVGGGQLLSDVALNFPLKLSHLLRLARRNSAPVAFNAIGVSSQWSPVGRHLFRKALCDPLVRSITLRDQASRDNLLRQRLPLTIAPELTVDPGIVAASAYNITAPYFPQKRIGLGISNPLELATQAERPQSFSTLDALRYWSSIAGLLRTHGYIPTLFTNGAAEDNHFLRQLLQYDSSLLACPVPTTPQSLVTTIASFDAIIAHRLHANIVAYSLNRPAVSLIWDSKVRSFSKLTQRESTCLEPTATPEHAVHVLLNALATPPSDSNRKMLESKLALDVRGLLKAVLPASVLSSHAI